MISLTPPTRAPRPPTLREYQRKAAYQVFASLCENPLLVGPTGSGKTAMAAYIVAELVREFSMPTLWLTHRIELVNQSAAALRRAGLHVGIIKAGVDPDPAAMVQVAQVQTLTRRRRDSKAELIICDEAQHVTSESWQTILSDYPDVPRIGLTATPFRLEGRGLGETFGKIIVAAYADELVAAGWLHAPKVYAGDAPDLRGVHIQAGDYAIEELSQRVMGQNMAPIVETWQARAAGRRTVAFAVDVAHSRRIVEAFTAAGIAAEHIDGNTPADQRSAVLERLRTGETSVVSNCMVLGEGWDLPALECAILARPTASLNVHLQQIGRVMRACPGKGSAIVLDFAGNHHTHGLVTRRLTYSLDGDARIGKADPLGLRQCLKCYCLYESKLRQCPECGYIPSPVERTAPGITGTGELHEYCEDFDYRAKIWSLIEAERVVNEYAPEWSAKRYEERFGARPLVIAGELVDTENATAAQKEAVYRELFETAKQRGYKPGWCDHRYRSLFGVWPRCKADVLGITAEQQEETRRKFMFKALAAKRHP